MKQLTLLGTLTLGMATATVAMEFDHDQLIQTDRVYKESTAHCPTSAKFRTILHQHRADVQYCRDFDFPYQDQTWTAQNIQTYLAERDFTAKTQPYLPRNTLREILSTMPLVYDSHQGSTRAVAQFSIDGKNILTLQLAIKQ